ncbi:leucine-rich repeat domain-containing protein [Desulfosporosinus youngiae]|uniref:Leucine Rich Repeat (LRR)-containing protein n=1 Tax=Desulfosporosinus youngiae DSM 17734 TaxID=768710 RepID=H5Y3V6_9FIRM|nr:hypothetical protein [Desulfosporosinus youngiae]EHQ89494.1 Leucine Rich Repeat (LRR)-containing protein [Desulfosporosinus youngiae DSM 17734]
MGSELTQEILDGLRVGKAGAAYFYPKDRRLQIIELRNKSLLDELKEYEQSIWDLTIEKFQVDNKVFKQIAALNSIKKLTIIGLNQQQPSASGFKELSRLPGLSSIAIKDIQRISASWFKLITGFRKNAGIMELEISGVSELERKAIPVLAKLPNLEKLVVSRIELGPEFFKTLVKMTSLETLILDAISNDPNLVDRINLSQLKKLTTLNINHVPFQRLPSGFKDLIKLEHLDVSSSRFERFFDENTNSDEQQGIKKVLSNLKSLNLSSSKISSLPKISFPKLETLNMSNTVIKNVPGCYIPASLKQFHMRSCNIEELKGVGALEHLETLDISLTAIKELPEEMVCIKTLKYLDIGNTKITKLREWITKLTNLKYLGLTQLKLDTFPQELATREKVKFYDKFKSDRDYDDQDSQDRCEVYVGGLRIADMDVRYLTLNDPEFLQAYYGASDKMPLHRGNVIFLGDVGVGKTNIIERLLDIDEDEINKAYGLHFIKEKSLFWEMAAPFKKSNGEAYISNNADIHIIELSGYAAMQLVHPLFLPQTSVYVIVLDARKTDLLFQRAQYWSKLVEAYSPNSTIIYVLNYAPKNRASLSLPLLKTSIFLKIVEKVILLETEEDPDQEEDGPDISGTIENLGKTLAEEVSELGYYTQKIPRPWQNAMRHVEDVLESRTVMSYKNYLDICKLYGMDERAGWGFLRTTLSGNSRLFIPDDTDTDIKPGFIYHTFWFENGIYRIIKCAELNNGRIEDSVVGVWENIIDSDSTMDYSINNIKMLMEYLQEQNLSYHIPSEKVWLFPGFLNGLAGNRGEDEDWINRISLAAGQNHFFVECPIISHRLLSEIICRTVGPLQEEKGNNLPPEGKQGVTFLVGQEGVAISFPDDENWRGGSLLMIGSVGCPGMLHIYAVPVGRRQASSRDRETLSNDIESRHLQAYAELVFGRLTHSLKRFRPYFASQYKIYVEQVVGEIDAPIYNTRANIMLSNIISAFKAGRPDYFIGELGKSEYIVELYNKYISESVVDFENNKAGQ